MLITSKTPAYVELLRTIGIPNVLIGNGGKGNPQLMESAQINKIGLLYSSALSDDIYYKDLLPTYKLLIHILEQVSSLFNRNGIRYSIFKTIKPFPTTPSDIDILLSIEDFSRAEALLLSSGYKRTTRDSYSSTLKKEMIVDLQLQPSVSNVPYLSKQFLMQNTVLKNVYGFDVHVLNPEAEAIVVASHSLYKEQLFTLNDYYTITILAEQLDVEKLVSLAQTTKILDVLRIIVGICQQITESVFTTRLRISDIGQALGSPPHFFTGDNLPMKFPFGLVLKLLISRAGTDEDMRRMMMPALMRLASPKQFAKLISHMIRKTY